MITPLEADARKCPAYREFDDACKALSKKTVVSINEKEYPIEKIRPFPDYKWLHIWGKFMKTRPSEAMILKLAEMNEIRDEYVRPFIKSKDGIDVLNNLKEKRKKLK